MTPEEQLASRMSRVEALLSDHGSEIAGLKQNVSTALEMMRAFAPLVGQMATLTERHDGLQRSFIDMRQEWRDDVKHFDVAIADLNTARQSDKEELLRRFEEESRLRIAGQEQRAREERTAREARAKEDRTNQTLLKAAALGFMGTFLTALVAAAALVVT